jgi:hypothetical protein
MIDGSLAFAVGHEQVIAKELARKKIVAGKLSDRKTRLRELAERFIFELSSGTL